MKDIVITSYSMNKFYGAGIYQTTTAYATAFKKLGYNVKMLLMDKDDISILKVEKEKPLTWLGLEYISTKDLKKLDNLDYLIYMGFSDKSLEEGGSGIYDLVRKRFDNCKVVYASFYNVLAGLIDGLTDSSGFLSVKFESFSSTYDEVWMLESHDFGIKTLFERTFKKVKLMPLLVFEKDDYIQEYSNNKVGKLDISHFEYNLSDVDKDVLLNVDPNSKYKNAFMPIVGSLEWLREKEGRHISIGNAFPLWVNSDGSKNENIYEYFKKYMRYTLDASEYYDMLKQNDDSLIWFYERQPIHKIITTTKTFAVIICVIGNWEKWNVLLMDLLRMGVPVIHNFDHINVGWKYKFPDADSLNTAINTCYNDLFENNLYEDYKKESRDVFESLSTIESNKEKIINLLD